MSALERRVARWPEVVSDLLLRDLTDFPRHAVGEAITDDFGCAPAWNWMDGDAFGFELKDSIPDWPGADVMAFWERAGLYFHPLIRWFSATACPSPMTVARVPRSIAPERCFAVLRACMGSTDMEQQLSIPYVLTPHRHRAFVLARAQEDFSDEDLEVARRLQPLLVLLERQVQVLGSTASSPVAGEQGLLTGRERAVLVLLERGDTAEAIARALGISPRTVHKHLENLYRKLGVCDRLRAVMVARDAHLLAVPDAPPQARQEIPLADGGTRWSGRHSPPEWWTADRSLRAPA